MREPLATRRGRSLLGAPGCNAALFALATEVPAAIVSRKLDLTIDVAVYQQRLSAGDLDGLCG